jgi:quercetin dioxygenase-like cupin family protein
VLFEEAEHGCQLRYFEVAPGGHTTLERHQHVHAVLVLRGRGTVLIGDEVREIGEHDLCSVPPLRWHQFRAAEDAPLGFLCLVSSERDRPQLPSDDELAELRKNPAIAGIIRT